MSLTDTTSVMDSGAADALAIAGVVPLSTVDWPGKLAATVFLQGCPLACPYCQNEAILDPKAPGVVAWDSVRGLLAKRRGLLDGVVFTGGEALRQAAVVDAAREVHDAGFAVGLHTSGAYPRRLRQMLPLLDWVGVDIKAAAEDYAEATGFAAGHKAWDSLDELIGSGVAYEVRTTVYPGAPATRAFEQIVDRLRARGVQNFALQEARTDGTPVNFRADALAWDLPAWKLRLAEMVAYAEAAGFETFEARLA